jgi:integrase/recombinase XerD
MSAKKYKERSVPSASEGVELTRELIGEFIENIRQKGYVEGTLERYQRDLEQLRESLTGEKRVGKGTLEVYRRQMLEDGYAPRTVNLRISAANSLLGYLGLREYQLIDQVKPKKEALPEISRTEYLQLLCTARAMGRERVYLLVKLFATTDLPLQELSKVTVESAAQGVVQAIASGIPQAVHLPPVL